MRAAGITSSLALALACLLPPGVAQAQAQQDREAQEEAAAQEQAQAPEQPEAPGEWRITIENDSFLNIPPDKSDKYYTNGMRAERLAPSGMSGAHFVPGVRHEDWCSLLCGAGAEAGRINTGWAVGHEIYTPDNPANPFPQPNDRPWAGLLQLSRIARISYEEPSLRAQRQDRIELSLGVVGPLSLAEPIQVLWHELGGWYHPAGWRHQLRNEPTLQLRYESALRWPNREGGRADIVPRLRANLGNALTSMEAEVTVRYGRNLSGFGVRPAADGRGHWRTGARWLTSWNLFVRAEMKAVAHDITLDGNTFARNHILIRRKPFVPEIAGGVEFNIADNMWLSYQLVYRGSDFERRNGRDAPAHTFGSLTLSWTIPR